MAPKIEELARDYARFTAFNLARIAYANVGILRYPYATRQLIHCDKMKKPLQGLIALIAIVVAAWLGIDLNPTSSTGAGTSTSAPTSTSQSASADLQRIAEAAEQRQSGFMVTVPAKVIRLLPDDNEGSRHQKFLVRLANDQTLLVAHNIDLASRVPLERGDDLQLRGQYEWNERGGVLHWTHHDPKGWRDGGWIVHNGNKYE